MVKASNSILSFHCQPVSSDGTATSHSWQVMTSGNNAFTGLLATPSTLRQDFELNLSATQSTSKRQPRGSKQNILCCERWGSLMYVCAGVELSGEGVANHHPVGHCTVCRVMVRALHWSW